MAAKVRTGKSYFSALTPEQRKEFGRLGGQTTQRLGKAHIFTPEEAREAGKKGGRSVSRDRAHMAEIGHRGGVSPRRQRAKTERP
ncbi:MAG TPA: KGG domain-containing protein [Candidatus Binatia bacterium]|jgi:hypothetical protein|nr:KGG domain-containing protein [Candidatus Binatia bacterium]